MKYNFRQYIVDLWHYVKPFKVKFFTAAFLRLTSDITRLYPAWAISQIVQIISEERTPESYNNLVIVFIAWGLATIYIGIFHNFSKYIGYQVAENASLNLYKDTLSHIFRLDFAWQEKENSGNKMKRIDKGLEGVNNSIRRVFDVLIEALVNIVGITIIFFSLNKTLSFALVFFIISFYILGTRLLKKAIHQESVVNKSFENLEGFTFESLNNIQTIKSLAIDKGVFRVIEVNINHLVKEIKKRIFYYQSLWGALNLYEAVFKYVIILYLGIGVYKGIYEIGLLVLFVGLFDRISTSSVEMAEVTQELAKSKIWISRAKSILSTSPTIDNAKKVATQSIYDSNWQEISVRNLSFAYKDKKVLDRVSFTIGKNEKVGIVGLSGAGKSTLFKLFLDLYENYKGNILLDRTSLKDIQRQSYIDHVSVVLQDTELFDMSLEENITIASSKNHDRNLLSQVINQAHLDEVVESLPRGINTLIGEKGVRLSGGQKQRLGIARALYRQPDILLLDEATSHLDSHSEKEIQHAILESVGKFTAIVIAHRLSTIKAMDKIIVLDNGKVVEQGKFQELLDKKGVFAKMWQDQKI